MNLLQITRILAVRRRLRRRERWTRDELAAHQATALAELRAFAARRSPFYRDLHRGLARASLGELPVLTKATLMARFDAIATDPALRLAALERHLAGLRGDERFAGRYWVSATSGSSGLKSIIPSDPAEWATIIASYARANEWGGIRISPLRRVRMGVVSSRAAYHQSARVARTVETPLLATLRLDAGQPLGEIIAALDRQQPEILVAYASMLRILADEQLAGRLHIAPRIVNCSSEVLTANTRARATQAWRVPPFEVYAATETGGIAAECDRHRGMHLFEDLVIAEPVNDAYRPVEPGTASARLLVTVLFGRSLPLIRYELTDRVRLATADCDCGRPFRLIAAVEGRTDDLLRLPGRDGGLVSVHPVVFHRALDLTGSGEWQVRQEPAGLRVLVTARDGEVSLAEVERAVRDALAGAGGVNLPVHAERVAEIPAGASGKRPLVVALAAAEAPCR